MQRIFLGNCQNILATKKFFQRFVSLKKYNYNNNYIQKCFKFRSTLITSFTKENARKYKVKTV